MEKLLDRLRRATRKDGLSLRELGRRSGIHHSSLSRRLRGDLAPTPRLVSMAPALGVDPRLLYNEAGLGGEFSLEETLQGMGMGDGLNENRLGEKLALLASEAASPKGGMRIPDQSTHRFRRKMPSLI